MPASGASSMHSSATATRRPRRQRALLAALPVLLLLALAELGLWAAGDADPNAPDPSRGFDPSASYLVPDVEVPGGFRTQVFGGTKVPEIAVPPKGTARRVLLFGGSNTMLFPEFVLAEALERRAPAHDWEVVNLGRAGYGSERVAILFEQALQLEPDLMVVYSGHNEFVERGFAAELTGNVGDDWRARLSAAASRLRSYRWLVARLRAPAIDPLDAPPPAPVEGRPADFSDLRWSDTLSFYAFYETNLARMARLADDAGVELLLCTVIANSWSPPHVSTPPETLPRAQRRAAERLLARALEQVPERWVDGLLPARRLRVSSWYGGGPEARARAAPELRALPGALASAPAFTPRFPPANNGTPTREDRKAVSIAGAHWPSPEQWSDEVFELLGLQARVLARRVDTDARARLQEAERLLDEALALAPDLPDALFLRGLVLWLQGGRDAEAAACLHRSAARDRAPRRASDTSNAGVRRVAASTRARLADLEAWFRAQHPDDLVGYETMMDHCHLQPGARVLLMERLAEEIVAGE